MLRALAAGQSDDDDPRDRHPRWSERVARVQAFATRFGHGVLAEATYRRHVRGMIVDDDPRQAALVGHAAVFARAHEAIDLPAWTSVTARSGSILLELPGNVTLELRALPRAFADALARHGIATDDAFVTPNALFVVARGPGAAAVIRALRRGERPPRADELAQIRPHRIDLDALRPLWPGK
jgi:hypothetical protein